ncbi:MAG TPA: hypothetical protein VLW44_17725 [Streptosporangiaceae bacterium]|nr:hypothetical protein [Streptosporangiaceae bacterium]
MADPWEVLQSEATAIVAAASDRGVTLRVVGSAGIRLHCAAPGPLMDALDRPAKDIDFVVPQRQRKGMRRLLEERGYVIDRDLLIAMEGRRYSFEHREHGTEIDVFVERLSFCHTIELAGRLERHPVTIPIEELLLQKVQIVEMTTTDLIDASVLLATHDVASPGDDQAAAGQPPAAGEAVDAAYIARLLARDWGFHHTATRNLARVRQSVAGPSAIGVGAGGAARAERGVGRLLGAIDAEDKSLAWRMRDKIGERKQWWQDVDDREATY